ncbi:MAG TPA: C39 family peptidase [Candidatus Dormibacteraeota bacterium]|nr:C39 family peptidase [Candidatus Dormibacteraeota bacterium]
MHRAVRRRLVPLLAAPLLALAGAGLTALPAHAASNLIAAPVLQQQHSLSCEAAALRIALAAKGIDVSEDWILNAMGADLRAPVLGRNGVVRWGDPYATFVGNVNGSEPSYTGYGVYDPPIAFAAGLAGAAATPLEGVDPQTLYQQVMDGNPVVVWVVNHLGTTTLNTWTAWDGRTVPYSVGEHAMTLLGVDFDDSTVTLGDPGNGSQFTVDMPKFENSFASFGRMAVVVRAGYVGIAPTADGKGYVLPASDGSTAPFGDATSPGSLNGMHLNRAILGAAPTPTGKGMWLTAADGGVFTLGDAQFYGSEGGTRLNQPVVGMAATPTGKGYWLVASDGGIFSFGDARFFGSMGGTRLNQPVVGMAATPSGRGYWLVASDGGIFCFGDAAFKGSTGGTPLNKPVVGMAPSHDARGYWLVAADGGIFPFGDAVGYGSLGARPLNRAITAMATTPDGAGYWLVAADGGVFTFGDARFYGSAS